MTDRRIVPIDDAPLRKRAAAECGRAQARLDQARAEWRRFEQEDRPAFARWLAATFGTLLTEARDNTRLILEQEALIEEVEMEMIHRGLGSPRQAYAAVMQRRANGGEADAPAGGRADPADPAEAGNDPDRDFDPGEEMDVPPEEREAMFEEILGAVCGIDPARLSPAEYARMFAEFEAEMFGDGAAPKPAPVRRMEKPSARPEQDRIRQVYRFLVRGLHPDLRADGDASVAAIWHEVQAAYEAGNLERLETLLALTEVQGANGAHASLAQMRGALEELHRGLRAMQGSLREAKRDRAWRFSQTENHGPLEKRVRRELEQTLAEQRWVLTDLRRTLAQWSRPRKAAARKHRKPAASPPKPVAPAKQPRYGGPQTVQADLFPF